MKRNLSVFRRALEGERLDETITVKGPLGEAMTKALNVAYAKVDPVTGEPTTNGQALESQAQEVTLAQTLVNAINDTPDEAPDNVEIYAVSEQDVDPETVVDVVNDMDAAGDNTEYVVIADASAPQNEDGTGQTPSDVVDITHEEIPALEADIKEGAFHKWLGKSKKKKLTKKDINKGLKSKNKHVKKMAQFAKNMAKEELDELEASVDRTEDTVEFAEQPAQISATNQPETAGGNSGDAPNAMDEAALEAFREKRTMLNQKSLRALESAVLARGGKFFYSLEDYVESLVTPENPETAQEPGQTPESTQDNGKLPDNGDGANGANGPGNTDHISAQSQVDGGAQPGVGQTND